MIIRPLAELRADFPDDQIEQGSEIVQFGGRGVAQAIADIFENLGYEVFSPEHAGEHGWDFRVRKGRTLWIQVTDLDDHFVLLTEDITPIWTRVFPPKGATDAVTHADALTDLNRALAKDARFSQVDWYTQAEMQSDRPGAKSPVG